MLSNEDFIKELKPDSQQQFRDFLSTAAQAGFDLRITSGFRSNEEQAQLYANGRGGYLYKGVHYKDETGKIVTNAKPGQSEHNLGTAIDIVDRVKGYNLDWNKLAGIAKHLLLSWGGDWASFPDKPHFSWTKPISAGDNQDSMNDEQKAHLIYDYLHFLVVGIFPKDANAYNFIGTVAKRTGRSWQDSVIDAFQEQYGDELNAYKQSKCPADTVCPPPIDTTPLNDKIIYLKEEVKRLEGDLNLCQNNPISSIGAWELIRLGLKKWLS